MSQISYYNTIALVSLIVFILLLALDIFIWVKLDIRHYLAVLTGTEARKNIDKIRQDAESGEVQSDRRRGNKAIISWNTTGGMDGNHIGNHATTPLTDTNKTVLLGEPDPYATMVLDKLNEHSGNETTPIYNVQNPGQSGSVNSTGFFEEKEIVNTASNENT